MKFMVTQFVFFSCCVLRSSQWSRNFTRLIMTEQSCKLISDFKEFKFSPSKLLSLPVEENRQNYVRRSVKNVLFSYVEPSPLSSPSLVSYSDAIRLLNLHPKAVESQEFIDFLSGCKLLDSAVYLAHRYGGHQFGYWASQLGDGRAILLGEYVNSSGERWEVQAKGSGKTPYSRDGDGRAVLRSSIREHICSEAMHYLGIPTSRSGAIVRGQNRVMRDPLYDGHALLEPTAIVLRIAPSWFRIGSLEILARNNEVDLLTSLVNFVIKEHFPDIQDSEGKYLDFLSRVYRLCSDLVVEWQCVGFTHGVLNTDNISLVGVTIDYGPFGFMDDFSAGYVPNHSDSEGRYSYGNQTRIMVYNLLKLTQAIAPLLTKDQLNDAVKLLEFEQNYLLSKLSEKFSSKLGLKTVQNDLIEQLLDIMSESNGDFTMTFRELSENTLAVVADPPPELWALKKISEHKNYPLFIEKYTEALEKDDITDSARMEQMCKVNPRYILRNWMAQDAIKLAEEGDYSEVDRLLRVLKNPYKKQEEAEDKNYSSEPPEWSKTFQLSCSS